MNKKNITAAVVAAVFAVFTGLIFGVLPDPSGEAGFQPERAVISADTDIQAETSTDVSYDSNEYTESESEGSIFVYVCGQVKEPDVYELPSGSRVYEAIEAAGGALSEADLTLLNLADTVDDGQKILVPAVGETAEADHSGGDSASGAGRDTGQSADGTVNINTAGMDILKTLPGIGDARAEAIISYRQDTGRFASIEEVMNVPGISNGIFEKIRGRITVD